MGYIGTFNRTFVELKYQNVVVARGKRRTFNRTFVELKSSNGTGKPQSSYDF